MWIKKGMLINGMDKKTVDLHLALAPGLLKRACCFEVNTVGARCSENTRHEQSVPYAFCPLLLLLWFESR